MACFSMALIGEQGGMSEEPLGVRLFLFPLPPRVKDIRGPRGWGLQSQYEKMSSKIAGPLFDEEIRSHIPPDPPHKEFVPPRDRAFFADPEKRTLLSAATKVE